MLKVNNLSTKILKDINIQLGDGAITGLVGANGSGKSTLAKVIIGLEGIDKGKIKFKGKDITDLSSTEKSKLGICYILQHVPSYPNMKIKDYFEGFVDSINQDYFKMFDIKWDDYKDRYFDETLSGGERKKLEIILNFMLDKDLYIIDEIETNLDQYSKRALIRLIQRLNNEGKSFIIISHNEKIQNLSDRSILLCEGEIKMIDKTDTVLQYDDDNCKSCEKIE